MGFNDVNKDAFAFIQCLKHSSVDDAISSVREVKAAVLVNAAYAEPTEVFPSIPKMIDAMLAKTIKEAPVRALPGLANVNGLHVLVEEDINSPLISEIGLLDTTAIAFQVATFAAPSPVDVFPFPK